MSLREQYAWVASRAIDGTTTTMDFPTNGAPFVLIEVLTSSSLSVKAGLMGKAGTDRKVRSFLLSGASTETQVDPDTATGTVAAQDFLLVPSLGAKTVRITRAAGSGTLQGVANPSDAITPWLLMKLLDAGISVTTTPPAVQCYTFIPDGTDELLIDATARKLWGVDVFTIDATPVYVKLYDKATAASEADTPIHRTGVPANATSTLGAGNNKGPWPVYIPLTNGLSVRAVTGLADNSDAAVTTAENYINVYWST